MLLPTLLGWRLRAGITRSSCREGGRESGAEFVLLPGTSTSLLFDVALWELGKRLKSLSALSACPLPVVCCGAAGWRVRGVWALQEQRPPLCRALLRGRGRFCRISTSRTCLSLVCLHAKVTCWITAHSYQLPALRFLIKKQTKKPISGSHTRAMSGASQGLPLSVIALLLLPTRTPSERQDCRSLHKW